MSTAKSYPDVITLHRLVPPHETVEITKCVPSLFQAETFVLDGFCASETAVERIEFRHDPTLPKSVHSGDPVESLLDVKVLDAAYSVPTRSVLAFPASTLAAVVRNKTDRPVPVTISVIGKTLL